MDHLPSHVDGDSADLIRKGLGLSDGAKKCDMSIEELFKVEGCSGPFATEVALFLASKYGGEVEVKIQNLLGIRRIN